MGDACFSRGYNELAEFGYKIAVENEPENRRFLEKLGEVYELRGNYSAAIDCWKKISKFYPHDGQVRAKITGLEASRVMDHGGYEGAKTTQEVKKTAYDDYRPATDKHVPDAVAGPVLPSRAICSGPSARIRPTRGATSSSPRFTGNKKNSTRRKRFCKRPSSRREVPTTTSGRSSKTSSSSGADTRSS